MKYRGAQRPPRTVVGLPWEAAGWSVAVLGAVITLAAANFDAPTGPVLFILGLILLVLGASTAVYARR